MALNNAYLKSLTSEVEKASAVPARMMINEKIKTSESLIQMLANPMMFNAMPIRIIPESFKIPKKKKQFRFSKSKKKRIKKKFAKDPKNFREVSTAYIANGAVYMTQTMYEVIKDNGGKE